MATPELVSQAESLLCRLEGVLHAQVHVGPRGIDAIHVTAADHQAARTMAGHVRSALLAGLSTPVLPARIHVRVAEADPDDARTTTSTRAAPPTDPADPPLGSEPDGRPRHRIRIVDPPDTGTTPPPAATPEPTTPEPPRHPLVGAPSRDTREPPGPRYLARPRLVAVDVDRALEGRVRCSVAVAYGTLVHRAEAVAVDLPGAAAQAAAQAAVRALVDAGLAGLELNGLREVEIAGRDYVLVALRRAGTFARHRSGSAPIVGSPERSAAEAAVHAATDML